MNELWCDNRWFISVATFLLFVSCNVLKFGNNKDVDQLRNHLPQIQIPIEFSSDRKAKYRTIELPDNKIIERLTANSSFSLFGKLFESRRSITILGFLTSNSG